jgi:AraC family transcriptional regulator
LAMFGEPSDCSGALYVTSASLAARSSPRIYRGGTPARLRKVVELVHAEMDGDLSLEKLANAAGLSITHFSQMFRQSTGQSPHQFVLHRRLELAKRCCVPPRIASWMWR